MKKLFAAFLLAPFFLSPSQVISTEKELSQADASLQYGMTKTVIDTISYYQELPGKPVSLSDVVLYSDNHLTIPIKTLPANTPLEVTDLLINDTRIPVFVLKDGSYTLASQQYIVDDRIISRESHESVYWLQEGFTIYKDPYRIGVSKIKTKLSSYTKVDVIELAVTLHGTYYHIKNHGWVEEGDLSSVDNRLDKVKKLLDSQYNKGNLSISINQLSTGLTTGINQNKVMYSASVAKLPILYYVQQQINQGRVGLSDRLKYIDEVNDFEGAYKPEGSGSISKTADNEEYTVEELLKAVAKESDNVATNILAYYLTDQFGEEYRQTISSITNWDPVTKEVSAEDANEMMVAIYHQGGHVVDYLSSTRFDDQRIPKDIDAKVAHKIGDAYEFRHDVAIIYGDNPFVIAIFTENMSYDDISEISKEIYTILK